MTQIGNDDISYSVYRQDSSQHYYSRWTAHEDALLEKAVNEVGPKKWMLISKYIPGRTAVQCSARWSGALNPNIHKGRWSKTEDQALIKSVNYFQNVMNTRSSSLPWNSIAQYIPHRTGIQCQARWTEALDSAIRKGRWYPEEDSLLQEAVRQCGCCWIRVASMIPTRTQRQCRTRWNQIQSRQIKQKTLSTTKPSLKNPSKNEKMQESRGKEEQLNEPLTINTDLLQILPHDIDSAVFTLDDIFTSDIQLDLSPSDSRMGSMSPYPPTPVDSKTNSLQNFMELQKYPDIYCTDVNQNLMLSTDFDSVFNSFNLQQ